MSQQINLLPKISTAVATLALTAAALLAVASHPSAGTPAAASPPPVYCTPGAFGWDKDAPCLYT